MRPLAFLLILSTALLLPACGGGGQSLGNAVAESILQSAPPIDDGATGNVSAAGHIGGPPLFAGDTLDDAWRAVVGFDLRPPIEGNTLERATLKLDLTEVRGDPSRLGRLWVEAIELGGRLHPSAYAQRAYAFALTPADPYALGLLEIDVTPLVNQALARDMLDVDLRLRFSVPNSGADTQDGLILTPLGLLLEWK